MITAVMDFRTVLLCKFQKKNQKKKAGLNLVF